MSMGRDGEEVAEGGREEGVELLLGENLEEGRLLLVKGAPKGRDELHEVAIDARLVGIDGLG